MREHSARKMLHEHGIIETRIWRKGVPIPEGWVLTSDLSCCHHGRYNTMIIARPAPKEELDAASSDR